MTRQPQALALPLGELTEGLRAVVDFTISAPQMQQFAELSGDYNPLHTDAEFARGKGFEGAVVYGALMVAKVSQLIGMQLPGRNSVWASVALEFRKPLYVDQPAQAEGIVEEVSDSTGMVVLKLTVRAAGKVLAKGRAEVIVGRT
ncbi:MaoC/PaaZ C-terminal domain-containing protein [Rhodoferax sp. WC2427]|uniref:MaoC/PaaZ C-terminal domain-containing protein n=1 Tax=Rhodoferax sp. WC2427 TaxID=3234144 RepID=UPI003466C1CC